MLTIYAKKEEKKKREDVILASTLDILSLTSY